MLTAGVFGENANAIIAGCTPSSSGISSGVMLINGELLPFEGGTVATYVNVVESQNFATFYDGILRPAYIHKKAVLTAEKVQSCGTP